jgi:SAM-dependent methyltransferase
VRSALESVPRCPEQVPKCERNERPSFSGISAQVRPEYVVTLGTLPSPIRYDRVAGTYARYRKADPRIARAIRSALGDAHTVVNVGAGTGSYEPVDLEVVAVEPSAEMIRQRSPDAARVVQASAEALPFVDSSFDAALAVLTLHHWADRVAGLRELSRVARERVVVLTHDTPYSRFWLIEDYFPELASGDPERFPTAQQIGSFLAEVEITSVPIPHDCTDGFLGAYWRRPLAYLDAGARSAISAFAQLENVQPRLARLEADVRSGAWAARNATLLGQDELDLGYRLLVGRPRPQR